MKLLADIRNSIYNPQYYKSLSSDSTLGSSIKYLAKLSLLVSLISAIVFSFTIPRLFRSIKNGVSSTAANYPDDLVVTIKNGEASVNKPEPYLVPISDSEKEDLRNEKFPVHDNIIVIDTTQPFSLPQFKAYSSLILLTKTEIVMLKDSSEQIQIVPLSRTGNWEITKTWVLQKEAFILRLLPWAMFLLILIVFAAYFLVNFAATLVSLVLYAFVIWLMAKIAHIKLSYKNSYRIGIHAVTLLMILWLFGKYWIFLGNFFVKLMIVMILVYINFFRTYSKEPG